MSGITGWIDWEKNLTLHPLIIESMTEALTSRGPDGSGNWISAHCALGHRRLSVVDLENGTQPMSREHNGHHYVIVYNGELYNAKQLRGELLSRGHTFKTTSDTEVLLLSFIEWGKECLDRFNGMYAFAIWHREEESLFMARDRLGIKPLFYSQYKDSFAFASEPKAILAHPDFNADIGREGLAELFMISPARTPGHGIFTHMRELKPGCCLEYNRNGAKLMTYWQLESKPHTDSIEDTAAMIRTLLQDAVELQLQADVPVGTLLSGGLDSSAITALAVRYFNANNRGTLHTYSVNYVDNDKHFKQNEFQPNDDTPWIERMTELLQTSHRTFTFDIPELVESLDIAMHARDMPGMADVDSSLYLFCREIKKEVTVALSGEAADELFGGYPWFHRAEALQARTFPWSLSIEQRLSLLSPELIGWLNPEQYVQQRYEEALSEVPKLKGEDEQQARMRAMFYLNLTRFAPTLLERKDRMSMAAGLEARLPFTDHRLVEYVWNIPWDMKQYGQREKGILRHALRDVLPNDVLMRKKSPYPKTHHPNYTAAVRQKLIAIINEPSSPLLPLINIDKMNELLQSDAQSSSFPWFGQLMTGPQMFAYFIQMNEWLKRYQVTINH